LSFFLTLLSAIITSSPCQIYCSSYCWGDKSNGPSPPGSKEFQGKLLVLVCLVSQKGGFDCIRMALKGFLHFSICLMLIMPAGMIKKEHTIVCRKQVFHDMGTYHIQT
jgi:hypothetical protein